MPTYVTTTRVRTYGAVAAVVLAVAGPGRADQIDNALAVNARTVFAAVGKLGVEQVAVLNFAVRPPEGESDFRSGLANVDLARRLENALILANDPDAPLFVLTDAGLAARKLPAGTTWKTAEGRAALATIGELPLAWDVSQKLKPEGFVTGELAFGPDCTTATLTVYGFTAEHPDKLVRLAVVGGMIDDKPAAIPADRGVLAMAGIGYVAASVPDAGPDGPDAAARRTAAKALRDKDGYALLADDCPVKLTFVVNGEAVRLRPDPAKPGAGAFVSSAVDPKRGDEVSVRLENTSPTQTYAVLLAVNGENTNALGGGPTHLNDRPAKDHRMWLIDPLGSATVHGFYTDPDGNYKKFEVLGESESEANFNVMSDAYRGLITMHVYRKRPAVVAKTPPDTADPNPPVEFVDAATITMGVGGKMVKDVRAAGSLRAAQKLLADKSGVVASAGGFRADPVKANLLVSRGLIVEGGTTAADGEITKVDFGIDPDPVAYLSVRYYDKPQ